MYYSFVTNINRVLGEPVEKKFDNHMEAFLFARELLATALDKWDKKKDIGTKEPLVYIDTWENGEPVLGANGLPALDESEEFVTRPDVSTTVIAVWNRDNGRYKFLFCPFHDKKLKYCEFPIVVKDNMDDVLKAARKAEEEYPFRLAPEAMQFDDEKSDELRESIKDASKLSGVGTWRFKKVDE